MYTNLNRLFHYDNDIPYPAMVSVKKINLQLNLIDQLNIGGMFLNLKNLETVEGLNNGSVANVNNIEGMFQYCGNLYNLNVSNGNMHNVRYFTYPFYSCRNIKNLDLSQGHVDEARAFTGTFMSCGNLTDLNLANWDVSKVTYLYSMCAECYNLCNLDLTNGNLCNVTSLYTRLFARCNNLSSASLESIGKALSTINAQGKTGNNLSNLNSSGPFYDCTKYINSSTVSSTTAQALIINGGILG